jgi:hypothetical protein
MHRCRGREATYPQLSDHRPSCDVSGSAVRNRGPPICEISPKKLEARPPADIHHGRKRPIWTGVAIAIRCVEHTLAER